MNACVYETLGAFNSPSTLRGFKKSLRALYSHAYRCVHIYIFSSGYKGTCNALVFEGLIETAQGFVHTSVCFGFSLQI